MGELATAYSGKQLEIIEAAAQSMATRGFEGTTTKAVAQDLGIVASNVFYYFPTNNALLNAVQEYLLSQAEQIVAEHLSRLTGDGSFLNVLEAYLKGTLLWANDHRLHVGILLLGYTRNENLKDRHQFHMATTGRGVEKIYTQLGLAVAEGELKVSGSIKQKALMIHHLLVGACVHIYYTEYTAPQFDVYTESFLGAVWDLLGLTRHG